MTKEESYSYTKARLQDAIEMINNNQHHETIISMIKSASGELSDWARMYHE